MQKRLRIALGPILVVIAIAFFIYYALHHENLFKALTRLTPGIVTVIVLLYFVWLAAIMLTLVATVRIARKHMHTREGLLLTSYSTLVNFFVPGQSGPVVRGVYLKKKHSLSLRTFTLATLIYYGFYAVISTLLLVIAIWPWWLTLVSLTAVGIFSLIVIRWYIGRSKPEDRKLDITPKTMLLMLVAAVIQGGVHLILYTIELHVVNPHISFSQAVTYTGAANFSLFVALTPGAIGIREAFLLLSQHLNHISTANILAASIIDRGSFLIFLGILFILTVIFHAKNRLKLSSKVSLQTSEPS